MSDVEENEFSNNNEIVQQCKRNVNWDKCLCHIYSSSGGKSEQFTQKSWDSTQGARRV